MYSLILLQIDNKGVTLNTGPGSYKIPMINDIPKQFNVTLLEDSVNDKAVYGSKVCTFLCNFICTIMMRNSFRVLIINGISPNKTIVASVMFGNLISFRLPFHTQATPSLAAC